MHSVWSLRKETGSINKREIATHKISAGGSIVVAEKVDGKEGD